jgi:hypothetical protein
MLFNIKEQMRMRNTPDKKEIERAARMYKTSADAARALGIAGPSFSRLCRKHSIPLPKQRGERKND